MVPVHPVYGRIIQCNSRRVLLRPPTHVLAEPKLLSLASGKIDADIIIELQKTQLSKNLLLMEAFRRSLSASKYTAEISIIESAINVLAQVQMQSSEIVTRLITLPQFGLWAADSLIRSQIPNSTEIPQLGRRSRRRFCHLASFAAAAGLISGHNFDLMIPIYNDCLYLPSLGALHIQTQGASDWARIRLHNDRVSISVGSSVRPIVEGANKEGTLRLPGWNPTHQMQASSKGLPIRLLIDNSDPFFSQLGTVSPLVTDQSYAEWKDSIAQAWQILTSTDRLTANSLATGLTTIVPLLDPLSGHSRSASSGWAWGAISLSLQRDPLSLAETLVHEFHHLVLGAVEDLYQMVREDTLDPFTYAPWRDDPRPTSSLLQGAYAFLGVARFWLRQRDDGTADTRKRSEVSFALRLSQVRYAVNRLSQSAILTDAGRRFLETMSDQVTNWQMVKIPFAIHGCGH